MSKYFKRSEYDYVYGIMVTQAKASSNMFLQEYNRFRQTVPAGSPIWNEVEEHVRVSDTCMVCGNCLTSVRTMARLKSKKNLNRLLNFN